MRERLVAEGVIKNGKQEELHAAELQAASTWNEGTYYFPNSMPSDSFFRLPKLSVPNDYYERVEWSNEYYEQEPLIETHECISIA